MNTINVELSRCEFYTLALLLYKERDSLTGCWQYSIEHGESHEQYDRELYELESLIETIMGEKDETV